MLKDIKDNTVFQCRKITSCWLIFIFNISKQSFKKTFSKSDRYTDLQTCFSEKNIWCNSQLFQEIAVPKLHEKRFVFNNVIGCGCLNTICYWNILAIFQANILNQIHNNYYKLWVYITHALSISMTAEGNSITVFYFPLISKCLAK